MNMLLPEFVVNQKAGSEIMVSLMAKGLDGLEKLIALNAQVVNMTIVDSQGAVAKALAARDPQAVFVLQTSQARSAVEQAQSYWRHVYEILSTTQGEVAEVAEAHFTQSQRDAHAFVDSLAKSAPPGSEAFVFAWKSALGVATESANSAYDAAKKAAKQAVKQVVDVAESNGKAVSAAANGPAYRGAAAGKGASA